MKSRNATIDYLRGLAALMVCVCHYRHTLPDQLAAIAKHGEIGVQIFFVISGFIIPYSMEKAGYRLVDFGRFWLKRLVRLQPTFLAALVFTFLLSRASSHFKGGAVDFSFPDLAASAVYWRVPSENPVIWTLIVELKYYLFISLLFPLLFSVNDTIRRLSFLGCMILATLLLPYAETLRHAPCFLLGFAACYLRTGRSTPGEALILSILGDRFRLHGFVHPADSSRCLDERRDFISSGDSLETRHVFRRDLLFIVPSPFSPRS